MDKKLNTQELYEPHAEQALIASLLIDGSMVEKIQPILPDVNAFFDGSYRNIYQTMLTLHAAETPIDLITLTSENKTISFDSLNDIITDLHPAFEYAATTSANAPTYAGIVSDAYIRRQLYEKMQQGESVTQLMQTVEKLQKAGETRFYTPQELALQAIALFEGEHVEQISYPFRFLQTATNGIHKGQVVIVAGRPGTGKSTLLDNIAVHAARQKKRVLFASAEMSTQMLMMRIVTRMTGRNVFYTRHEQMTLAERERVDEVAHEISEMGLHIQEFNAVAQLEESLKNRAKDFDLIIVDYLQLLTPKTKSNSSYDKVTNIANELTQLAKRFNVPFVVAAQFSREAEKTIPTMAHLKESGQIEQNADVIISLYSQPSDIFTTTRQRVRIDMLKNRNGYCWGNSAEPSHFLWFEKSWFEFTEPEVERR